MSDEDVIRRFSTTSTIQRPSGWVTDVIVRQGFSVNFAVHRTVYSTPASTDDGLPARGLLLAPLAALPTTPHAPPGVRVVTELTSGVEAFAAAAVRSPRPGCDPTVSRRPGEIGSTPHPSPTRIRNQVHEYGGVGGVIRWVEQPARRAASAAIVNARREVDRGRPARSVAYRVLPEHLDEALDHGLHLLERFGNAVATEAVAGAVERQDRHQSARGVPHRP